MANAASGYVVPIGSGVATGIWGPGFDSKNYPVSPNGVFDIFGPDGTPDPRGVNASAIDAWNAMRLGYGTVDAPGVLGMGANEAMRRYAGDPNNGGAGGWDARWKQWNATDQYNPDGTLAILSPMHQTGLRISQNYGARDYDGNVIDASGSDLWNTAKGVRNNLNSDPYLDPGQQLAGLRAMTASSAYGMPDPNDYVSGMRNAIGGPGQADFYGQRGLSQTQNLDEVNQRQLTRGIDREAQETLANRLPEVSQAMEAAGLGRSGAGQLQMLNAQKDILSQANRDKQRTMADFTDRAANREASAINLGSQIGAQGYGQYADQMGRGFLQGQSDLFQANQQGRQNEQALWSQAMQNRFAKNQGDQSALFGMLTNAGAQQNDRMRMEDQGRSMALADWLGLQANRDNSQASSLDQALKLANAQRQIQQDRLNQMLQAGMQPWETQLRIATGTTAPSSPQQQNNSFWNSQLGGQVAGAGANWLLGNNQGSGPVQSYQDFQSLIG
jgi:hypothetical protein